MRTTADEHIEKFRQHLDGAIAELGEVVANHCYGHDEYTPEFTKEIDRAYWKLLKLRNRVKR